jgi:hypothetical protein
LSLIDDALKQAQATHQEDEERSEGKIPWTPPPLPDRSRLIRARIGRILGVSLLTVLAAGVTAVIVLRSRRPAPARSPASDAVQASSAAVGLPPITSEVAVAPPQRVVASGPLPAAAEAPQAGVPPRIAQGDARAAGAREKERPVKEPEGERARLPSPSADRPLERKNRAPAGPAVFAGEMPLPEGGKITLDGIVYSETNPVAVLNGKILPPGAEVDGYTITRIDPDKIELERDGKSVSLTLR